MSKTNLINPILQRELAQHYIVNSAQAVLNILQQAESGNILAQSDLFADMEERDAQIFSEMYKRKMAVAQLDWSLKAPRDALQREIKAIADLENRLRDMFSFETIIFDMCDAIGKGFSAHELDWNRDNNGFWLPDLHYRTQRWFTTDIATRQEIRLRDMMTYEGEALVPNGWIIHRHASKSTGYFATSGLFRVLALPYLFKNFAVKNWLRFCELYAVPIRVLMSFEEDEGKKQELLQALSAIGSTGSVLLQGNQEDLKTVDAATGEGQGFNALIDYCDKAISKAILGGTLTSQADGKTSTNALGSVHDDVRIQIRNYDALKIAETLNAQFLGAIISINGLTIRPKLAFDTQEVDNVALYADALPKLAPLLKIPASYVYDKLKIPMPQDGEEVLTQSVTPAPVQNNQQQSLAALLNEPVTFTKDQQVIEHLADDLLLALSNPIESKAIQQAIKSAKSPEDLEDRLAVLLKNIDFNVYQKTLEQALFAADVWGYVSA
jgi:phage gp29-like protein